jgi:cytochrome c oxidase subunit 1
MIGGGIVVSVVCILVVAFCTKVARSRGWIAPAPRADGGYLATTETEGKRAGLTRWLTTVDHKDIGLLYLTFGTIAALWGGVDAMMLRTELLTATVDVWSEETYSALFTTHGTTMLFFFITPTFFGIANYFLPLLIGADDLAFPRLNAIGFWLLPPALLLVRGGLVTEVFAKFLALAIPKSSLRVLFQLKPPAIGWTMYTPLSIISKNPQINFFILGLHLSGIATTIGAINFIVTVFTERAADVTWADIDLFTWAMITTAGLIIFAFPLLGAVLIMLLSDRNFGTAFFMPEGGGPILYQHLFWFFGHPEVYIIVLPGFGLMSLILPKFAGRKIFGRTFVIYSTLAIGVLSYGVWAHHMFTTGLDPRIRSAFMAVSLAIAIPSAIKEFNWITTLRGGNVRLTAPMIFCVGGLSTFVIGGITGVFQAAIPIDILYHDTYYVVGHFHMILMGLIPFMMFAASYYWFPIITGRMFNQRIARIQAMLMIIGVFITFGTLIILGMLGMPRRYASYPAQFTTLQRTASFGAYIIGSSVLLWLGNMLLSARTGRRVTDADVWNLKPTNQFTREWQWFEDQLEERYGIESSDPETVEPASATELEDSEEEGEPTVFQDLSDIGSNALAGGAGGIAGTIATLAILYLANLIGIFEISALGSFADFGLGPGRFWLGLLLFVGGGLLIWPNFYVALVEYLPGEELWRSGLTHSTILWTGFVLIAYTGQTGLQLVGYVIATLVAHWAYGLLLAGAFSSLSVDIGSSV